jgi:hypothetical protein
LEPNNLEFSSPFSFFCNEKGFEETAAVKFIRPGVPNLFSTAYHQMGKNNFGVPPNILKLIFLQRNLTIVIFRIFNFFKQTRFCVFLLFVPIYIIKTLSLFVFLTNEKYLAYHLKHLCVPLVVRVPQVGNPCIRRFKFKPQKLKFLKS